MELKAFIGPFLYRGLYKLNTMGIPKLFSDSYGPPTFSTVMSRNRLAFILHNLSFDDESIRAEIKTHTLKKVCLSKSQHNKKNQ